jgi:hypothetical protein
MTEMPLSKDHDAVDRTVPADRSAFRKSILPGASSRNRAILYTLAVRPRRDRNWLAHTDAAKPIAGLFRHAHIALPPRVKQLAPPKLAPSAKFARMRRGRPDVVPRRREFRRNLSDINQLRKSGVEAGSKATGNERPPTQTGARRRSNGTFVFRRAHKPPSEIRVHPHLPVGMLACGQR